jgi:uncharacterized protein YfeS
MEDYGINKHKAHPNASNLINDSFFWDNTNEYSPFGSDEGDTALEEFRKWRANNKKEPLISFIQSFVQDIEGTSIKDYLSTSLNRDSIELMSTEYEEEFTIDITIIATCFGQFVDEGQIDIEVKDILLFAIHKQEEINKYLGENEFVNNLNKLYIYTLQIWR